MMRLYITVIVFWNAPHFVSSRVFADKEAMMAAAVEMAEEIAGRSPVAVQGTKINLIYARDHSVAEGLDYMVRSLCALSK